MNPKQHMLFPLSCFLLVTFVSVRCQTSVTVPYIKPMLIGRTFDVSKSNIGSDIFDRNTINLKTIQNFLVTSNFKMVKTKKQVRDVLDISGQLSLQIMAGMVNVKGEGRYLKETTSSSSFVEVLAKITFQTITETIDNVPTLTAGWNVNPIGQHYVRGITYGGYLIAKLKFEAKTEKDKELIEARVKANIKKGTGSIGVQGQFKKLAEAAKDISTLSISYTATVPLKEVPTDIDSLIKAIKDFPNLVKSSTRGGNGVPIEAHLLPLSELDKHKDPKLQFLIDGSTQTSLDALNSNYFDLISTRDAIKRFTSKYRLLTNKAEQDLGKLYDRVFKVLFAFNQVIASLDLRNSASQFDKAYNAYREGSTGLTGKFMREFDKMIINKRMMVLNPPDPVAYEKNGILYLSANNSYTAVAQAAKVTSELLMTKTQLQNIKHQLEGFKGRFLSIYIKSEGCDDERPPNTWCRSTIKVNGMQYSLNSRGHNFVVVNPDTGVVTDRKVFDTHLSGSSSTKMKNFINSLPKRRLVLVAVKDEASRVSQQAIASLESIGARNVTMSYRSSYALIGWTGPGALDAVTQVQRPGAKGPSIIATVIPLPL